MEKGNQDEVILRGISQSTKEYFSSKETEVKFDSFSMDMAVCKVSPISQADEVAKYLFRKSKFLQYIEVNGCIYHRSMAYCPEIIKR